LPLLQLKYLAIITKTKGASMRLKNLISAMIKVIACAVIFNINLARAEALPQGTFKCKNHSQLPDNIYKFTTVKIDSDRDLSVPYVEIRRFLQPANGQAQQHEEVNIKGFATAVTRGNTQTLVIASSTFEFINGELQNCKSNN